MDDWGENMLQSRRESRIVAEYDEKFGLRELRAKICDKSGFQLTNMHPFALSILEDVCFGPMGPVISRKYLDSGPLAEEFATFTLDTLDTSDTAVKFVTLTAATMTLGCKVGDKTIEMLRQLVKCKHPALFRTEKARLQMGKAAATYVSGTPYSFGGITYYENFISRTFVGATVTTTTVGCCKLIKAVAPNGMEMPQIIGPPTDEELGINAVHPHDVCASCGRDALNGTNGGKLLVCGVCKERKYCSQACQKKHWKLHKPICARQKEEMEKFLSNIPLNFHQDAKPDMEAMVGGSMVVSTAGVGATKLGHKAK